MKNLAEKIDKPFRRGDLVLYIVLAVIVGATFFLTLINGGAESGFSVYVDNELVMTYSFATAKAEISVGYESFVIIENERTIKIQTKYGYNLLHIENGNVTVTDADCGFSKECTHMSLSGGAIICAPHRLKIVGGGNDNAPQIG